MAFGLHGSTSTIEGRRLTKGVEELHLPKKEAEMEVIHSPLHTTPITGYQMGVYRLEVSQNGLTKC